MNTLSWTATVPPSLKAGAYLIRFELLALHQANTPQFYPEYVIFEKPFNILTRISTCRCANLIVTGGGSAFPSSSFLAPMPGAWGANDPGVNIDIYSDAAKSMTTYPIPGPPLWSMYLTGIPFTSADHSPQPVITLLLPPLIRLHRLPRQHNLLLALSHLQRRLLFLLLQQDQPFRSMGR